MVELRVIEGNKGKLISRIISDLEALTRNGVKQSSPALNEPVDMAQAAAFSFYKVRGAHSLSYDRHALAAIVNEYLRTYREVLEERYATTFRTE